MTTMTVGAVRDLLAEHSGDPWLALYTIDHADMAAPLRLTSGSTSVFTSRGVDYAPAPIEATLPSQEEGREARSQLTLAALPQAVLAQLPVLTGPVEVDIEIVRASEPDVVQTAYYGLLAHGWETDLQNITAELSASQHQAQSVPNRRITRDRFPLFPAR